MDTAVEDGAVRLECELALAWGLYGPTISGEVAPGSGLCADVTYLDKSDEEVSGEAAGEKIQKRRFPRWIGCVSKYKHYVMYVYSSLSTLKQLAHNVHSTTLPALAHIHPHPHPDTYYSHRHSAPNRPPSQSRRFNRAPRRVDRRDS